MNTEHVREEPDADGCICPQDFTHPDCPRCRPELPVGVSPRSISLDYVNRYYGTAFKIGQRVAVNGRPGTIVPRADYIGEHYLAVQLDASGQAHACHPTWKVEIL